MSLDHPLTRESRRLTRALLLILHLLLGMALTYVGVAAFARMPRTRALSARSRWIRWWSRALCRIMHVELRVSGAASSRPALFVINHVSWLDIPCLLALLDANFVSKQDVLRWPAIGAMAARADTLFLDRGARGAAARTANDMTWRLASRRGVIFCPEATTSDGTSVRTFYARLFQAAIRTHSPVQAIAIGYSDRETPSRLVPFIDDDGLLPHLWRLLGERQLIARIQLCEPLVPNADRRSLAEVARTQIRIALGQEVATPITGKADALLAAIVHRRQTRLADKASGEFLKLARRA